MKKIEILKDEERSTATSYSYLNTFGRCRKATKYPYIDRIYPKSNNPKMVVGSLAHAAINAMLRGIDPKATVYAEVNDIVSGLVMFEGDTEVLWAQANLALTISNRAYIGWGLDKWDVVMYPGKPGIVTPALELHFRMSMPPRGIHGYIDAILQEKATGHRFIWEFKFRESFRPAVEEDINMQMVIYQEAARRLFIPAFGYVMAQASIEAPKIPSPNAGKGDAPPVSMSRAKIKTDWPTYKTELERYGFDPAQYADDMIPKLAEIEWVRILKVFQNQGTVDRIFQQVIIPVAKEASRKSVKHIPWPNHMICNMCQYKKLCYAELRGDDVQFIMNEHYMIKPPHEPPEPVLEKEGVS